MMEFLMQWLMARSSKLQEYGDEGKEVADVAVHAVRFYRNPTQASARALKKEFVEALNAVIPMLPKE
jgi:hypothetical protein